MAILGVDICNSLLYCTRRPTSSNQFSSTLCLDLYLLMWAFFLFVILNQMAIVDNRLNKTLIAFNRPPADFVAGRADSAIVNLDTTVGEGIAIFGFEGIYDVNVADIATILSVNVLIFRDATLTSGFIFGLNPVEDYELAYYAESEDPQDREVVRDFSTPIILDKGHYYSIVFLPSATAPANNYNIWFTVRGKYLTKDDINTFYSQPR